MAVALETQDSEVRPGAATVAGVLGAAIAFALLTAIAMARNGWGFEYALDDVYIHLAMAEQIAAGGYGVNPGELSSAASSPLYPLLLTPLAGSDAQRWLPLIWNLAALVTAAGLLGLAFARAGLGKLGVVLAAIAPFAMAFYVTAFTGMENMAHTAASLAAVIGLWHAIQTGKIGGLLIAGILLASAFRLEGVAIGLLAGGLFVMLGRPLAGLGLIALAILPVALFSGALVLMGLDPLPNSVIAKMGDTGGGGPLATFVLNIGTYGGRYLMALSSVLFLIGVMSLSADRERALFAVAMSGVGFAHLAFGSIGWMDRYETYANASLVAALALALSPVAISARASVVTLALAGATFTYAPYVLPVYSWNPAAITAQHAQMSRFVKEHVKAPVAVNDLGYVSWRNPNYVLDLWGLASADALATRTSNPDPGWAGPLASDRGAEVAMVYDAWVGDAIPSDWVRLGTLRLDVPSAFLGGRDVAFYAINAAQAPELRRNLVEWIADLPPRASFIAVEAGG